MLSEEEKKAISKRLVVEEIKRFCELHNPEEGIGEQGLDELAHKILNFSKDYISKDKIKERIKEIDGKGTFDAKIVLEHLLEEN